ncbi:MAG: hypothetical protein CMO61_00870 [Verrucomicrobiales bacterium]|nr:hypothetical protein [Verrucomicrobiales bacterium]|tara:strand:- start:2477 stop:4549 length:2073 start_codon:yes stop_codon:yes gene_type:complete
MKSLLRNLLFSLSLSVAIISVSSSIQAREWTSTDGKKMKAIFLGIENEKLKFRLANGQEALVPADRFIKADQEAAKRLALIGDDSFTMASARQIDGLLAKQLKANGYSSFNEPLPDDLFVRRVYLDITGRIPTRKEFLAFAESAREDKRQALIDELLLSPGYASHMFNYFADMYRLHASDFNNGIRMDPYMQWWRDQLKANRPYDEIIVDMLIAEGNVGQNPAAGFILRDTGMEFDAFSNFGQVMLGIDISCAQCHDHPFEEWTQGDFYQMAAFFGNTQRSIRRYGGGMMSGAVTSMPNAPDNWQRQFQNWAYEEKGIAPPPDNTSNRFRFFVSALGWNVTDNETLETVLPHDFIGSGGKPNEVANPRTLVGAAAKKGGMTRRQSVAQWLTAPENPRFALVIANRMWDRAFGRALVGPVNDFSDDMVSRASQAEALKFVTREMQRVDYDLREFMRILYNTRAYQSLATNEEPDWADAYYFQGPILRRMRAEQAWDSMMVLANGNEIDNKTGADGSMYQKILNIDFNTASNEEVWEHYEAWISNYGGRGASAMVSKETGDWTPTYVNDNQLRASELQQPAPAASMLDTFGQSDRQITDDHNYDGSVPQVFALMNGSITRQLTGSSSKVVYDLEDLDGPDDKVRGVFFTLLNRFPSDEELKLGMSMIEDYGDNGISDLAWALMNSPEFLYIQ